ncbi:DUF4735 domain-containing protein [Sandaracinus amylolyticus]|uniref:Uncharacterized protein n=1 Tax=Sandaracinus amylolyticus TaxID=927083 RepID=A0A0F6YH44_9BACT|nr:DUF4735 domain-containing protein [Sandaracinus amylolyticus]AKF05366.1 hypothetical protein DB32_002515 [Sandaracinus amylolyticus]
MAALLVAVGCGGGEVPRAERVSRAIDRALVYLHDTDHELGVDVLLAARAYGARTGDARVEPMVQHRLTRMPAREVERYGELLDLEIRPFSAPPRAPIASASRGPSDDEAGELAQRCSLDARECRLDDACRAYVAADDQRGYALTHQAFVLVVAHARECTLDIDVDARRAALAARLRAELAAAARVDDLYAERLAMLVAIGDTLEPAWIDALLDAQQPEGCFPSDHDTRCHPHATGLALWALSAAR